MNNCQSLILSIIFNHSHYLSSSVIHQSYTIISNHSIVIINNYGYQQQSLSASMIGQWVPHLLTFA